MFHDASHCLILCFQVNDFVRGKTRQKDGTVPLAAEILAGGCVSLTSIVIFREENLLTSLQVKHGAKSVVKLG